MFWAGNMKKEAFYNEFAKLYDRLYSVKNYDKETAFLDKVLKKDDCETILEFACGTGNYTKRLVKKGYKVTCVDKNEGMLKLAKKKLPKVKFVRGDMRTYNSRKKFDAVLCMFTAINYITKFSDLVKTLKNFKSQLNEGGIMVFDGPLPSHMKEVVHGDFFPGGAVIYQNDVKGDIVNLKLLWMFKQRYGPPKVVQDLHKLRFYSLSEWKEAFKKAGLSYKVYWDWSLRKKKGRRPIFVAWAK